MNEKKHPINRTLVGLIALICLGGALGLWIFAPRDDSQWRMVLAACVRVGCLMTAFWLALPSRHRQAAWANFSQSTFIGILLAIVAVAAKPKVVILLIPILIVITIIGVFLRPREKKRPSPPDKDKS